MICGMLKAYHVIRRIYLISRLRGNTEYFHTRLILQRSFNEINLTVVDGLNGGRGGGKNTGILL